MTAIITLLTFTGLFAAFWIMKNHLESSVLEASDSGTTFGRMFRTVENNTQEIYITICRNASNIQSCSEADKKTLFEGKVPEQFWFDLAYLLERDEKCSGFTKRLNVFYFYDRRWGTPEDSCGNRLDAFVDCMLDLDKAGVVNFGRFSTVAVIIITCLVLLTIDIVMGFCLCYHPEREEEKFIYNRPEYRSMT
ncbi:MAG: hypothetical protein P4M11_11865 [Candidatus Pacebacteria bacterium]|nr:hypothetical protein [Candidatus Paceibacterota bacterium]